MVGYKAPLARRAILGGDKHAAVTPEMVEQQEVGRPTGTQQEGGLATATAHLGTHIEQRGDTDTAADNYEYTLNLSAAQLQQLLAERLGIAADLSQQAQWFGTPVLTPSGYVDSLPVCGQTVQGTALRKALGLRSACFTVVCQSGTFSFTTRGYGHGVGMSQWGAKALAEQGADYRTILAHYYPGTELRG